MSSAKSPLRKGTTRKSPKKGESPKKKTFTTMVYECNDSGLTHNKVEIKHLNTVIVSLNQKVEVTKDMQAELDSKNANLLQSEKDRDQLHQQHREYIQKNEEDSKANKDFQDRLHMKNEDLQKEINRLNDVINVLKREKADRETTIDRQSTALLQLQNEIQRITHELKIRIDVESQLSESRNLVEELEAQKAELKKQLTIASDYLIEQDDKVHKANKTSLELLDHLKDAELEIETLKDYIVELKHRIAVYIPVESDSVDAKLAEYINNYPERNRLKVMFMRESSGIYQFGTRKIFVKVEQDKIIIRVGGGFLTIDEFLDIYTPLEIEKLERKSPLKKFSEKVAVQKTCIGREIREDSPIRSPARSPKRGSPTGKGSPMRKTSTKKGGSPLKK
ncbi:unnamed protein product [Moneuplotes crassus]|uniref:GAR domain-containing protein n=1 Tax=Euplotes crassus TaxID=5936 RepID=A0AAD1UM41_EUPCR|nr:unnamed protein product [Moneuplotes crassus]